MKTEQLDIILRACVAHIGEVGGSRTLTELHEHLECDHPEIEPITARGLADLLSSHTRRFRRRTDDR